MDSITELDIKEQEIFEFDRDLLAILLVDRTTKKNIIWATTDYQELGAGYAAEDEINIELITGMQSNLIQPRVAKTMEDRTARTRNKAEVFTPSWVCNEQNNMLDENWFGRKNVFNIPVKDGWITVADRIAFPLHCRRGWKEYIYAKQLEVSCGEAPYLVSRYDTVTGSTIPISDRIGLLDRKLRIVNENTVNVDEWKFWAQRAVQSCYGFEYQGDNLLLARENVLFTVVEYYQDRFQAAPERKWLEKIAKIISWNIWQMDGLKYVVPLSCVPVVDDTDDKQLPTQLSLFTDDQPVARQLTICPGCRKNDIHKHTGTYCKIKDWTVNGAKSKGNEGKKIQRFVDLIKEEVK